MDGQLIQTADTSKRTSWLLWPTKCVLCATLSPRSWNTARARDLQLQGVLEYLNIHLNLVGPPVTTTTTTTTTTATQFWAAHISCPRIREINTCNTCVYQLAAYIKNGRRTPHTLIRHNDGTFSLHLLALPHTFCCEKIQTFRAYLEVEKDLNLTFSHHG